MADPENAAVPSQSVYEWCGVAIEHLQSYLQFLDNFKKDEAPARHNDVVHLLEEGINALAAVQEEHNEESGYFHDLKAKAQATLDTIHDVIDIGEVDVVIRDEIKFVVKQLVEECQEYRDYHHEEAQKST